MEQRKPIGELLIRRGVINKAQLQEALELATQSKVRCGEALVQLKYATPADITTALGEQYHMKVVDLGALQIPSEVIHSVPAQLAKEHNIVPIDKQDSTITMAVSDPLDLFALDNLRFILNMDIECVLSTPESIQRTIRMYYGADEATVDDMLQDFTESDIVFTDDTAQKDKPEENPEDAPVIKLVHLLITEALRSRASDIHIEPMEKKLRIRYRIDGVCMEMDSPPKRLQGSIISRVKIMSQIDIAEKRKPQDGRIKLNVIGKEIDLRVSCLPAQYGESVVMRILDKESINVGIQQLGFGDEDYEKFQSIIKTPNGIFLVTGPTGSGKSTTLYAALSELNRPDKKIITAENPVEYNVSGINQCEVNEKVGRTFALILRSMLRQAPNIILVGEIRDTETAEIAIQAALTGHLVFSTLHTNDATSAITRLIDMGVKPFLVASSIQAIMAQRLVRKICASCKRPIEVDRQKLLACGLNPDELAGVNFQEGAGCAECNSTGYKGRTGIFELMEMSSEIREMAFHRRPSNEIRHQARRQGMKTLEEDGLKKAMTGVTSLEEVVRMTQREAFE